MRAVLDALVARVARAGPRSRSTPTRLRPERHRRSSSATPSRLRAGHRLDPADPVRPDARRPARLLARRARAIADSQRTRDSGRPLTDDSTISRMRLTWRTYGEYRLDSPMETAPLLFDLGKPKPTTRADRRPGSKAGGAEALTEADAPRRRGPLPGGALPVGAQPVKGMPFEWTLNPYRGCTHGCHYCYARRYHTQFELGADDEFASVIFVKTNFVEVLRRELRKPSWAGRVRRARHRHRLLPADRRPLQADARDRSRRCCEYRNPAGVVTKGPMIVRDKDVLADLSRARGLQRLHQRPVRRRGRLAAARAGHRASAAAPARRARAGRRRRPRRRADEPDRAGHLVEAGAASSGR